MPQCENVNMAPVKKPKPQLGGTFLKQWREFRGKRQQEAADAINVSRELLSKIESGKSPYLQQHLEGLARLYGCSPGDLLEQNPLEPEPLIKTDDEILSVLARIDGLKAADINVAFAVISNARSVNRDGSERSAAEDRSEPGTPRHQSSPFA